MANQIIPYNTFLKQLARKLRKTSTRGEIALWNRIRRKSLGVEFHRQVPVSDYIVDFYCHELRLVVEIDGSSHNETTAEYDARRQHRLECLGLRFIRFTERDARYNTAEVVRTLKRLVDSLKQQD